MLAPGAWVKSWILLLKHLQFKASNVQFLAFECNFKVAHEPTPLLSWNYLEATTANQHPQVVSISNFRLKKTIQEEVSKGPYVKNSESNWSGFTLRTNCDLHKSWHFNWMENDLTPFFFLIGSLHSFKPQRNCMVKRWRVGWRARNRDVKTMSIIGLLPHSTPSYLMI